MSKLNSLRTFINGPLSDASGGDAELRHQLTNLADEKFDEDETTTEVARSFRELHFTSSQPLFSYQREVVDKLDTQFRDKVQNSALVSIPTGGGKTRTGLWFFREKLAAKELRTMLWVAPSVELVEQAVGTVDQLWSQYLNAPELSVRVNGFGRSFTRTQIDRGTAVFVTAQLAAKRADAIRQFQPDLFVFDEAHQAVARTFRATIRSARSTQNTFIIGLSATPGRSVADEGDDLQSLFGGCLVTSAELGPRPVIELVRRGVLSKLEFHRIALPTAWDAVRVNSTNSKSLSVDALAANPARFWATVDTILNLKDARTLVFAASLAHCFALVAAIRARGGNADVIAHTTPAQKRQRILARFAAGDLPVLVNKSLLATGYDCPGITDVVLATPIRSAILWEQVLGRGSRGPSVGGCEIGRIWELDDHRAMHGRVRSYARFLGDLWA